MKKGVLNLRIDDNLKSKLEQKAFEENRSLSSFIRNELEKIVIQNVIHEEEESIHIIQSFRFLYVYSWIGILKTNPEHKSPILILEVIRQSIEEILEFERFPSDVIQGLKNVLQNVTRSVTNSNELVYYAQSNQFCNDFQNISTYFLNVSDARI